MENLSLDRLDDQLGIGLSVALTTPVEEYARCLNAKLDEEVAEFHRDQNAEELADILEVVFALAEHMGCDIDHLMEVYDRKHTARGGFRDRIFLIGKE